jgi:hypothetical protein
VRGAERGGLVALRLRNVSGDGELRSRETSKTISIPIIDDAYAEGSETLTVTLSNATGASLGTPSSAPVINTDNEDDERAESDQ